MHRGILATALVAASPAFAAVAPPTRFSAPALDEPASLGESRSLSESRSLDEPGTLITRLRDPKLSIDQREALHAQLLAQGEEGAKSLLRYVEENFAKASKRAAVQEQRYAVDFDKFAAKLIESRLTREALKEVDKLRGEIAKLRADEGLTKERIHEVGDPAVARLKELLDVDVDTVLAADTALTSAKEALASGSVELEDWFALGARCNEVLPEKRRSKALVDPSALWPRIATREAFGCLLAMPMSASDREALAKNREAGAVLDPEESGGILDLNRLRIRLGLSALVLDLKLCAAAKDHSGDMRVLGFFAHESPVEGKKTPWDRAARFGTSCSGENIEMGATTGVDANIGWWYSPGHHKNMLGGHARVGLGRSDTYWTQMFG